MDNLFGLPDRTDQDVPSPVKTVNGVPISSPVRNVDADTLAIEKERYRLTGLNAPETAKNRAGVFIPNEERGDTTQDTLNKIATLGGYTDLHPTGKKDAYGRTVADEQNAMGDSLGYQATVLGVTDINAFSDLGAVRESSLLNAMSRVMPNLANADPSIRAAREQHDKRMELQGKNPLYMPKVVVENEATYAAMKDMVSHKAVGEAADEVKRLEGILSDPSLEPRVREKLNKKLEEARDDVWFGSTTQDIVGGVLHRQGDRTINNKAYHQWATVWDGAVADMKRGFYAGGQIVGEGAQWDWLTEASKAGVARQRLIAGDLPTALQSTKDIRTGGDTWDTITDVATYVGNFFVGTLPTLAMMGVATATAGVVAPAGAAAFGMAAAPSALMYTGQFWSDQPEDKKNVPLAVAGGLASAALDTFGFGEMFHGGNLFSAVGRQEAKEAMVALSKQKGKEITLQQADDMLMSATKAKILEMTNFGAEFAAKHYASKEARIAALKAAGFAGAAESGTELTQQVVQMVAQTGEWNFDARYDKDFEQQLLDSAIGGGVMGGTFQGGITGIDMAHWGSIANAKRVYEGHLSDSMAFLAQQKAYKAEGIPEGIPQPATSVLEGVSNVRAINLSKSAPGLMEMEGRPGDWNGFKSLVSNPSRLLRGMATAIVPSLRKSNGELKYYSTILLSILKDGTLPGDSHEGFKQRVIGEMSTPDVDRLATDLGVPTSKVNHLLKESWQHVWSKGERMLGQTDTEVTLQNWKDEADSVIRNSKGLMDSVGYDTSAWGNADFDTIFMESAIDPVKFAKEENRLVQTMVANKSGVREAREAVQAVISGDKERAAAAKEYMREHGVFHDTALNDLFEPDVLTAFENLKHRTATKAANSIYLGKDGNVLAKLLHLAHETREFASEDEFHDAVQNVQDYWLITNGDYNSLKNYPNIEKLQSYGVTAMMLAVLGKSALSSIPEIALATLGTRGSKIGEQLMTTAQELVGELRGEFNKAISWSTSTVGISYARNTPGGRGLAALRQLEEMQARVGANPNSSPEEHAELASLVKKFHKKYMNRSLWERLGFNDIGYNSQNKFETNTASMKKTMHVFASMIGLRSMTDATRLGFLAMAGDIMNSKLTSLYALPKEQRGRILNSGVGMSNEQYQSYKELSSWGIDVEKVLGYMDHMRDQGDDVSMEGMNKKLNTIASGSRARETNEDGTPHYTQAFRDEMITGLRNMTNANIANPQIANLPKYYHDPRLRIFTAMTRFVATATSTLLPRLYKTYIMEGSTGMRYQAFSTVCLSLIFAGFANVLKDIVGYADDDNPYLKETRKKAQRALYGSGLIGRAETAVDAMMPLYDNSKPSLTKDPVKAVYSGIKDSSATISWADRAVQAMYNLSSGNTERGTKQAVKSLPLVGAFPVVADVVSKQTK